MSSYQRVPTHYGVSSSSPSASDAFYETLGDYDFDEEEDNDDELADFFGTSNDHRQVLLPIYTSILSFLAQCSHSPNFAPLLSGRRGPQSSLR